MKSLSLLIAFTILLAGCSPADQPAVESDRGDASIVADTVYTNGKIYTVNESQPWAEAVAIKDGKYIVVGSAADAAAVTGEGTDVVDLAGAFAMPGIGDNHIHAGLTMPKRAFCALPGTFYDPTEEQTLDALDECIANYPDDREWFIGTGWSLPVMSPDTLTRQFLDELIPDRPAFIEDETGGHTAWFNTKAMEAAGLTRDFVDTPEIFYSRTDDGDIKGVAYEGGLNPFLEAMPPFDTELRKIAFMKIFDEGTAKGITAFGDAYTFEPDLQAFQELKQEGKLNQHIVVYFGGNLATAELTPVATLLEWWDGHDLPGHKAVKIGMDGALESISAPVIDGFADPENVAAPVISAEPLAKYLAELDAAGFQVKIHAIGDGSVRATLDGYESVITANGNNRLRHHIDHCSLIHPDDFQRFVDLDVSCSIWPPLNAPVDYNLGNIKPVLKPETWARMYANRDRIDAGLRLVNHSDAPGAVLWPWWGMEASVTRGVPGKPDVPKMSPDQAITVAEAIETYTINVAWSMLNDDVTGSIETGKWADMIVLNHNLLEIPSTDIHKTAVQKTIFKGELVYEEK